MLDARPDEAAALAVPARKARTIEAWNFAVPAQVADLCRDAAGAAGTQRAGNGAVSYAVVKRRFGWGGFGCR